MFGVVRYTYVIIYFILLMDQKSGGKGTIATVYVHTVSTLLLKLGSKVVLLCDTLYFWLNKRTMTLVFYTETL